MKLVLVCALLTVQVSLAIRSHIRTRSYVSNVGDTKGAGDVGPTAIPGKVSGIVDGNRAALVIPPAVKVVEAKAKPSNAVVTKEFCIQVLQDVAARAAPYFVDGKFTGECRKSLVEQCGDRMCEWAKLYKAAAADCPVCPSSCEVKAPSRVAFFSSFPSSFSLVGSQQFLAVIKKEMQVHVAPRFEETADPPAAPPAAPKPVQPCPASGCPADQNPKVSVTRSFCQTMLQDVIDGKAPYFIEGKFTGESRSNLISQCGEHICNWALRVHVAGTPKCGTSECCLPETCKVPQDYFKDVVAKGQLLDIIKLVGKDDILKSLDPSKPPASIPAQKDPPSLRGPVQTVVEKVEPSANDPRDPNFKKGGGGGDDKKVVAKKDGDDDDKKEKKVEKEEKKVDKKVVAKKDDDDDDDKKEKKVDKKVVAKKDDDDKKEKQVEKEERKVDRETKELDKQEGKKEEKKVEKKVEKKADKEEKKVEKQ